MSWPTGSSLSRRADLCSRIEKNITLYESNYTELDIRFVFSRSGTRIRKNSKTTYADWCRKHDFEFADKLIPANWFKVKKNTQALTKIKEFDEKSDVKKRK